MSKVELSEELKYHLGYLTVTSPDGVQVPPDRHIVEDFIGSTLAERNIANELDRLVKEHSFEEVVTEAEQEIRRDWL